MLSHRVRNAPARLALVAGLLSTTAALADLESYVQRPDPAFAWTLEHNDTTPAGKIYGIALTSQVWEGITWKHDLRLYEPAEVKYPDAVLLFITGGSTGGKPKAEDHLTAFALAKACGARVAVLPQVPNQPLLGGRKEDDLISETFVRYLNSTDEDWPLLQPMVKSAVKAMDAVQALGKQQGKPVAKFVVTGASKRGWTTWLTGAVDKRVVAIAPMVIPTLNMKAQNPHQLEVWGKYSEQIEDYVRRGLMDAIKTPRGVELWKLIDPYTYRDRLTMPKLQINGTNDRYWTLDSLNLYWDDLKGPSYVVYLPNAGHGLNQHRDYAVNGVGALCRLVISGRELPKTWWKHEDKDGRAVLGCDATPGPKSAQLWTALSDTQDFREARWSSSPMAKDKHFAGSIALPEKGYAALFGDMTMEIDGMEYHLSTQIRVLGPKAK